MNAVEFEFHNERLSALASGALFWPAQDLLVVSDLHLGKSARVARFGGAQLPPYETTETLTRLANDLTVTRAKRVICLGDSFDSPNVHRALPEDDLLTLTTLQAGRDWIWIEGNHDPGPVALGGTHRADMTIGLLHFRHIAQPDPKAGEVSGHYHPKATLSLRGRQLTRPCFLFDQTRLILPAYGAFTGGLHSHHPALTRFMSPDADVILTGPKPCKIPMRSLVPLS
jgi:DNA ligase-associated metallophosphoesterase